nr:hypothetical protein [Bacteroidota bacterium]
MKKIYLSVLTLLAGAAIANAQNTTITLAVDMSAAMLGEAGGACAVVPFNPTTDVVEAMGGDFNGWSAPENVPCNDPFTPDPSVDLSPISPGSLIYSRTYSIAAIANPADMPFKFRINHSWDNDELRGVNDGNRHIAIPTVGGTYTVACVFDVDGSVVVASITENTNNFSISMAPNPVVGSAKFKLSLVKNADVKISICDVTGKEVKTIAQNDVNAGTFTYIWNGDNNNGATLNNGSYFYSLFIDGVKVKTEKIFLVN